MGLKSKLRDLADAATLKLAKALTPDGVEEESFLDLKMEQIEGRQQRKVAGVPDPVPAAPTQPFYRKDGQVHNFGAAPYPGSGRRLTRAQYDARHGGARPVPAKNVSGLVDVKNNDFTDNNFETPTPDGFDEDV